MTHNDTIGAVFPQFPAKVLVLRPSRRLAWLDRQGQRAALARLEDCMLDDFGVTRDEAAADIRRWD